MAAIRCGFGEKSSRSEIRLSSRRLRGHEQTRFGSHLEDLLELQAGRLQPRPSFRHRIAVAPIGADQHVDRKDGATGRLLAVLIEEEVLQDQSTAGLQATGASLYEVVILDGGVDVDDIGDEDGTVGPAQGVLERVSPGCR